MNATSTHRDPDPGADLFVQLRASTGAERRRLLDRLVRANEPMVKKIVAQQVGVTKEGGFRGRVAGAELLDLEDANQVGRIALVRALEQYDPAKGALSTILSWKVKSALQTAIEHEHVVHAGRARRTIENDVCRYDDPHVFDDVVHQHRVELADDGAIPADGALERVERDEKIRQAIDRLDVAARAVVVGRLMDRSVDEVAGKLGITRERAETIYGEALNALETSLAAVGIRKGCR